jgi:hypothetical protein
VNRINSVVPEQTPAGWLKKILQPLLGILGSRIQRIGPWPQ